MINEQLKHRRSIRITGFDYSQGGAYFVTICTKCRKQLFGKKLGDKIDLTPWGKIVEQEWLKTEKLRQNVAMDIYQIMRNHFHGIVVLTDGGGEGVLQYAPTGHGLQSPSQNLGAIVRGFKSAVTNQIRRLANDATLDVWQRNYFEHVIRDDRDLEQIQEYIANNPLAWENDEYFI